MGSALLTALGLAAPAGLNAYLPLLIVALADRFSHLITLKRPYDFFSSNWGIAILTLLLTVEVVADKIPGIDHANDLIQSAIRPAAGAVLAMASTSHVSSINPVVPMVLGLVVAGSVHAVKATTRPVITIATGGLGNPIISIVEDTIAAVTALVALVVPALVLVVLVLFGIFLFWSYRKLRRRRLRPTAASAPPAPSTPPSTSTSSTLRR